MCLCCTYYISQWSFGIQLCSAHTVGHLLSLYRVMLHCVHGQAKASGKKLPPASLTVSPAGLRIVNMASEAVISDLDIYRSVAYIIHLKMLLCFYERVYVCVVPWVLWCCCLGDRKGIRPVKNWVVRCGHGYVSGSRCRFCIWPSWCHCHSLSLDPVIPDWFYLSGAGSPGLSWTKSKRAINGCVCVWWGWRAQCWVDAETVLCLRFIPVMYRHQLGLCESEKKGSLCQVEAPPCWYSLSLSRPTCYLHDVPLVTTAAVG